MSSALIALVGDVLVDRDDPSEVFSEVRDILKVPDILFANLEAAYSDDPRPVPSAPVVLKPAAHNLDVYANAGFNVMSMANNHIVDVGYEAMLETRSRLEAHGVKTCGAGRCLAEAHQPALMNIKGMRVAFLAYCCGFPSGYEAREKSPGLAPMRAYNYWRDPAPNVYHPGSLPYVITLPDPGDVADLTRDIRRARERADIVVTSFHWGDYTRPYSLSDHETRTARYCVDQGADMVVGHHHHVLRGIEWYRGKPILYGLGHFVFDLRLDMTEEMKEVLASYQHASESSGDTVCYTIEPREGWPLLPMHEDARMTVIAWATASRAGISSIDILPCRLTPDGRVRPLRRDSAESAQVVAYLDKCNRTQGLDSLIVKSDRLAIAGYKTYQIVASKSSARSVK